MRDSGPATHRTSRRQRLHRSLSNALRTAWPEPSASASASGVRLNALLWTLLLAANLVDVLASRQAFGIGVGELNPIVELLLLEYGMAGVIVPKLFWMTVLLLLLPYIRGWTRALFAMTCTVYLALTVVHLSQLTPLL